MDGPGRATFGVVVVTMLVCTTVLGAGVAGPAAATDGGGVPAMDQSGAGFFAINGTANNSSVQHENPEAAGEDGDLDAVKGWLVGRMAENLQDSTLQLSQGEYELAREYVGDDYDDRLEQFVDVAGETESTDDDETGETLQDTQENQREYVSRVQEYRNTLEEYREARREGDTARARELGRELDRLARSIDETGAALRGNFEAIENRTGRDLSGASRTIAEITANVSEEQAEVREDLFVETTLEVQPRDRAISFESPLVLEGRLRAANGSALADRVIALEIGNRTVTTRTDGRGAFVVRYRPVHLRTGERSVTVRYRPRNASVYLGDRSSVAVRVEAVTPTLSVDRDPATVGYGETVALSGRVRAAERGVPGVPVVLSLDGQRLGVARTDANGTFALRTALPAGAAVGEVRVRAQVAFEDRAIARTTANTTLRVRPTATALSLNATGTDAARVALSGRLRTAEGRPVANQPVALVVNGSILDTVSTDEAGRYEGTLTVPDRLAADDKSVTLQVAVAFDGRGTNLDDSREQALVTLVPGSDGSGSDGQEGTGPDGGPGSTTVGGWLPIGLWPALGAVLAVVILGVVGAVVVRRRRGSTEAVASESEPDDGSGSTAVAADATDDESEPATTETARERLEAGAPDAAVELAYLGVRETVGTELRVQGARTHWEFLEACRAAGLEDERLAALETLTETYEQAAFAPTAVDAERAREAISHAGSMTVDGE